MSRIEKVFAEFRKLVFAGLILLVVGTLVGFVNSWHSMLDWFADFRVAYIACATIPLVMFVRHDRRVVAVAATVMAVNVAAIAPWTPRPTASSCESELVAVSVNALGNVSNHDELLAQVETSDPDFLFVSELRVALKDRLAARFPHHVWESDADRIALFSRHEFVDVEILRSPAGRPYINAIVATEHGNVRVLGAHANAPFSSRNSDDRNANIATLGELASTSREPVLLLGDLNVSMFSDHYQPLTDAGLVNVRRGRGVNATWPSFSPMIPIDHVIHSDDFQVCEVVVEGSFGSDHLPLRAGLALKPDGPVGTIAAR